jgi:hypothetical protein
LPYCRDAKQKGPFNERAQKRQAPACPGLKYHFLPRRNMQQVAHRDADHQHNDVEQDQEEYENAEAGSAVAEGNVIVEKLLEFEDHNEEGSGPLLKLTYQPQLRVLPTVGFS